MKIPFTAIVYAACLPVPAGLAAPFKPNLGPDLPTITVTCGEVTLLLRQATQWTPGRIDFRGKPMTTERSAYGTVFSFPGVGFIGTAHLENEPEPLTSLSFYLNGQPVADPAATLEGDTFRLVRESTIRGFRLKCEIELKENRLYETTTVATAEAIPLKVVYHFMHAWKPTVSEYLAGIDAAPEETIGGPLVDTEAEARKFHIQKRVDWMAVYEPSSAQYAVSRLLSAPESGGNFSMVWNVPGSYRKYYLRCFSDDTVPAGFAGTWRMVTAFGEADPGSWKAGAVKLAGELGKAE
jgi:hypothetical protein